MATETMSLLWHTFKTAIVILTLLQHVLTYKLVQQNVKEVNITSNISSVDSVGGDECSIEGVCSRICDCVPLPADENAISISVSCSNVPHEVKSHGESHYFFRCLENANVNMLYIWNSNIDTITDSELNRMSNLTIFKMKNSPLSTVTENSFNGLYDLIELDFTNISLNVLNGTTPFSKLEKLISLSITQNSVPITNVSCGYFYSGSSLEYLDLSNNKIENIVECIFNQRSQLKVLILSNNKLGKIPAQSFQNLLDIVKIDLSGNMIHDVCVQTFSQLTNLNELNLNNNNLDHRGYMNLTSALKVFNISHNLIKEHNHSSSYPASDIEILDLDGSNFKKITGNYFIDLPYLQILHCSNMALLNSIETNAFFGIQQLKVLYLFNNPQLTYLSPDSFPATPFLYLESIYIHNNALRSLSNDIFPSQSYFPALKILEAHLNPYNCSCDVALTRQAMDDSTLSYVQPWKSGDTALICKYPEHSKFSGEMIYKFDIGDLVCEKPLLANYSNQCIGADYTLQVEFTGGLPNVTWTAPQSLWACDNKSFSTHNEFKDNYTKSTFTIRNPSRRCNGLYTAHGVNAVPNATSFQFVIDFNSTSNACMKDNNWPMIGSVSSVALLMVAMIVGLVGVIAWRRRGRTDGGAPVVGGNADDGGSNRDREDGDGGAGEGGHADINGDGPGDVHDTTALLDYEEENHAASDEFRNSNIPNNNEVIRPIHNDDDIEKKYNNQGETQVDPKAEYINHPEPDEGNLKAEKIANHSIISAKASY